MTIGVSITVTLKGKEEETSFLQAFQKALPYVDKIPGLLEFDAFKAIDKPFTYHLCTLWEDESSIEAWLAHPVYREEIRKGKDTLIRFFKSYRWQPLRAPKIIDKNS